MGGGWGKALNSLAIKQAMPARNAGMGDCSAAHPSISARLRVCLSTKHVLPQTPIPHASPNGLCANGRQVSVAHSQPLSQARCPCLSRIPLSCRWLASQKPRSFSPILCPWKSPKRIEPDQGSLALKLFTLLHRYEVLFFSRPRL